MIQISQQQKTNIQSNLKTYPSIFKEQHILSIMKQNITIPILIIYNEEKRKEILNIGEQSIDHAIHKTERDYIEIDDKKQYLKQVKFGIMAGKVYFTMKLRDLELNKKEIKTITKQFSPTITLATGYATLLQYQKHALEGTIETIQTQKQLQLLTKTANNYLRQIGVKRTMRNEFIKEYKDTLCDKMFAHNI